RQLNAGFEGVRAGDVGETGDVSPPGPPLIERVSGRAAADRGREVDLADRGGLGPVVLSPMQVVNGQPTFEQQPVRQRGGVLRLRRETERRGLHPGRFGCDEAGAAGTAMTTILALLVVVEAELAA